MIWFSFLLEKIFSWFAINADTNIIQDLSKDSSQNVFIVKKSIYYILFSCWYNIFFIISTAIIKIILFIINNNQLWFAISVWLAFSIGLNIILRFWAIVRYLISYKKNYWVFGLYDTNHWVWVLKKWDRMFRLFFDQSIWLVVFYVFIIVFFCFASFMYITYYDLDSMIFVLFNIFFFIFQLWQVFKLMQDFINLEMDFTIITKHQLKHYEQVWMWLNTQSIDISKVKSIRSNKDWKRWSFLDYWTINIFTDWDVNSWSDISLNYIDSPELVEKIINKLKLE